MDLLVLGGTRFLGRHLAEAALAARHRVTLLHRGPGGLDVARGAEHLLADRDGGLAVLAGRRWDAVVDTCGYVPRVVGASAAALRGAARHYTFVSSVSAYAEPLAPGADERAPLATLADPSTEVVDGATYGGLKAACERAADGFGEAVLIVRPGLIVGPHDTTDRFPYWPRRLARGGDVLAPGDPDAPVQIVDVRDLAAWMLSALERGLRGPYNAVGPARALTMLELLGTIGSACGGSPRLVWVEEAFLLERGVAPWTELPLWMPAADSALDRVRAARAIAEGLSFRPLAETARDTLAWDLARDARARDGSPALKGEREAELLAQWRARGG